MDTLAHGMIGAVLCSRTGLPGGRRGPVDARGRRKWIDKTFWWALGFGMVPDLASLGIYFAYDGLFGVGGGWRGIPPAIFTVYRITHSFLGMGVIMALILWWKPRLWLPLLAWPVHVLSDVPTHGSGRFVTPIFWPFTLRGFHGWNWWEYKAIFYGIWISIGLLWGIVILMRWSYSFFKRRCS